MTHRTESDAPSQPSADEKLIRQIDDIMCRPGVPWRTRLEQVAFLIAPDTAPDALRVRECTLSSLRTIASVPTTGPACATAVTPADARALLAALAAPGTGEPAAETEYQRLKDALLEAQASICLRPTAVAERDAASAALDAWVHLRLQECNV